MSCADVDEAITRVHKQEWARVVAGLARQFGDLDIAEDAVVLVRRSWQRCSTGDARASHPTLAGG